MKMLATRSKWSIITAGVLVVAGWTLLRFFVQPIIFDAVGQQVLAHQWLQGFHSGAITGPTNYIVKMLLIYMPADLLPGNPYVKLIVMTILLNVITYVVIFLTAEWIVKRFGISDSKPVWLVMLWVAVVSGSVFWIGFANSRNIEVAGGMLLLAAGLRFAAWPVGRAFWLLTFVLSSILFFADPLQLYMVAVPAALFMAIELWLDRSKARKLVPLFMWAAAVVLGYVLSRVLVLAAGQIWHVHFFPITTHVQLDALPGQTIKAIRQLLELYSGSADLSRVFLYLNPILFIVFSLICIWTAVTKPASRRLFLWAGVIVAVDLAVYVLSGSAAQDTNSRYLIMTLPAVVVSFAAVLWYNRGLLAIGLYGFMATACVIGGCLLVYETARNFDPGLSKDRHYAVVDSYMVSSGYPYGYASMNAGLPVTYLYSNNVKLLPLGCQPDGRVALSNLFFDRVSMSSTLQTPAREVPVILDEGGTITNVPAVCAEPGITGQLGSPTRTVTLSDGSRVLIYPAAVLGQHLPLPVQP